MGTEAAIFDLDRTLLGGASGPVINEALQAVGLMKERHIPGQGVLFKFFDLVGESRPTMEMARQMARLAKGWTRARAQETGRIASEKLVDAVQPFARPIIEEHHREGRLVVMATHSPYDLVKPLADALGLDGVIATRYGEAEGRYDGTINGEFVWGKGKLRAVQRWADDHGISLTDSYAYSDSYFDIPLLSAVGHPFAVNPDPRLAIQALVRRWPVLHLDVPAGVPKVLGVEPQQVLLAAARLPVIPYVRFDVSGAENIPEQGPAIICGNHRSYFDPMALGQAIAQRGRPVRFLGKKEVFDAPVVGQLAKAFGGIRVERGTGSDEPLEAAAAALRAGQLVAIMPEGTIPRGEAFFDPELKGLWGAARLVEMTGAPIVPVGMWGTERVWPRSARLPAMLNLTNPPLVTVNVGKPITVEGDDHDANTARIMEAISALLPPAAREKRKPREKDLPRTSPPAKAPTAGEHERARRPGAD